MRFSPDFVLFYGTGALARGAGIAIVPRIPHDSVFSAPRTPNTTRVAYRAKHCETNSRHLRGDYRAGASSDHGPMRARHAMAPKWQVEPFTDHITLTTTNTAIQAVDPATGAVLKTPQEGAYRTKETHITVALDGGKTVNAIVREPLDAPADRPACLFLHGSGTGKSSEAFGDVANAMASAGITTLVPDKRLDNYTMLHRDYVSSAHDYAKSLEILRKMAGREQIGNRHLRRIGRHMDRHRADATASGSCLRHPHLSPGRFGPSADDARSHQLSDRRGRTRCRQAAYSAHHQPWHTTHGTRLCGFRRGQIPQIAHHGRYSSTMASRTQPCRSNRARGC